MTKLTRCLEPAEIGGGAGEAGEPYGVVYEEGHRGMTGSGYWQAGRPTDLFGDCHRDEPLALRLPFHQLQRPVEGLLRSIAGPLEIDIGPPQS
jgi:hypothetical protein